MRKLALLFVMAAVASSASAVTLTESGVTMWVDSYADPVTAGQVVNDIYVHCDSKWLGSQQLVLLDGGGIYQHPVYDQVYPQPNFWPLVPDLEFDSVVTDGQSPLGSPSISGGAVDLGGNPSMTHNTSLIDIGWFVSGSDYTGDLLLARTTLSDDASGTWNFLTTASPVGGPYVELRDAPIVGGEMQIPEPATLGLLVFGGLGMLIRRRR